METIYANTPAPEHKIFVPMMMDQDGERKPVNHEVTEEVANKLLSRWVRRLHLEEWDITFHWRMRENDMADKDAQGLTRRNTVSRCAEIQMLDPADHFDKLHIPYDYEVTLVHELLHLTFADLEDSGDCLRDHLTHCMVDRMARALVAAEREGFGC